MKATFSILSALFITLALVGCSESSRWKADNQIEFDRLERTTFSDAKSEFDLTGPGFSKTKPESGPSVEIEGGFMVPYTTTIPGTDVTFEMIPIPGGKFMMGSPESEEGHRSDEGPQVEVVVEPFWMGKHEVTWAEYKQYMRLERIFKEFDRRKVRAVNEETKIDAVTAPSSLYDPSFTFEAGEDPDQPCASVTQFAAKQYTKYLSLLSGSFYRLPYEAEWEYACRAGTQTAYYFGDDPEMLEEHGWFYDNADDYRQPVGQKKPNPFGLYDMYGNVSEWVLDQYEKNAYQKLAGKVSTVEETFTKPTKLYPRISRGGSWELPAEDCRSAARFKSDDEEWKAEDPNVPKSPWWYTDSPALGVGFRLMRPLRTPETREAREAFWSADIEEIEYDANNRIKDNGRGSLGIIDEKLPEAIKDLSKKKK